MVLTKKKKKKTISHYVFVKSTFEKCGHCDSDVLCKVDVNYVFQIRIKGD